MQRSILLSLFLVSLFPGAAHAFSMGLADTYHPSYGGATHASQFNEWLGDSGETYDGLSWTGFVPGQTTTLTFDVRAGQRLGNGDYLYLSTWIDWNLDRLWTPDEEVVNLDDYYFNAGQTFLSLDVDVPVDAVLEVTWLRTRLAFGENPGHAGDLLFGEVEDYEVPIGDVADPVPEPGSLALLGCGIGIASFVRKYRQSKTRCDDSIQRDHVVIDRTEAR